MEGNMHYANGREAKIGDLVRGRGYTIKREIVGKLISYSPQHPSYNCSVATVTDYSQVYYLRTSAGKFVAALVEATIEDGRLDSFVAIDPKTGEVLPPASGEVTTREKRASRSVSQTAESK
jgi:hypothetical protein